MSQIIERLYLGNIEDARNIDFIRQHHISIIINLRKTISNFFEGTPGITYYNIPIDVALTGKEFEQFEYHSRRLLPIIYDEYMSGKTIFVHCLAGMQRSAGFVLLFIIYLYKQRDGVCLSVDNAELLMMARRPNVFYYGMDMKFEEPISRIANEICGRKYS